MPEFIAPGVYIEETSFTMKSIEGVSTSTTAFVGTTSRGPANSPVTVTSVADFERTFGALSTSYEMEYVVRTFFANGGREAVIVRVVGAGALPRATEVIGSRKKNTGLYALEKVQRFGLLCLPPVKPGGDTAWSVYRAACGYCKQRRAMVIVDSPASWGGLPSDGGIKAMTEFTRSRLALTEGAENAALYVPRILQADPLQNGQPRVTVSCGAIGGVLARSDMARGVWKALAGPAAILKDVLGIQRSLNVGEEDLLETVGINCLRNMNGTYVVWGGRTLSMNSDWKYVPVRRLALFIEASIESGILWAALEPNGEPLWMKLRALVEPFLLTLFTQGALQGTKPDQAYFVKCDQSTMTQRDIEKGLLTMLVGFAPVRPAEFVVLRIQARTAAPA